MSRTGWCLVTTLLAAFSLGFLDAVRAGQAHALAGSAPVISVQPKPASGFIGTNLQASATVDSATPAQFQWFRNGEPMANETSPTLSIPDAHVEASGYFHLRVENEFGATNTQVVALRAFPTNAPGAPHPGFSSPVFGLRITFPDMLPTAVDHIVPARHDAVLIAGYFITTNGPVRTNIARMDYNGVVDASFFAPDLASSRIHALTVAPDGKVLVGGRLNISRGEWLWRNVARLNSDGSFDESFAPNDSLPKNLDEKTDTKIRAITLQPDGKILVGGYFTNYNGSALGGLARLNDDGSVDDTFRFNPGISGYNEHKVYIDAIESILLSGEKIVIGGVFRSVRGEPRYGVARLFSNGEIDPTFTTAEDFYWVRDVMPVGANQILIAGSLFGPDGVVRLNADGTRDITYDSDVLTYRDNTSYDLEAVSLHPNGKLLIAGDVYIAGVRHPSFGFVRLNADGSLDRGFLRSSVANSVLNLPDGTILVGRRRAEGFSCLFRLYGHDLAEAPTIERQPTNRTISIGANTELSVTVSGLEPLTYQWRKDGVAISGATSPSLAIPNASTNDLGSYTVKISNVFGDAVSEPAVVAVENELPVEFASVELKSGFLNVRLTGTLSTWYTVKQTTDFFSWYEVLRTNAPAGAILQLPFSASEPASYFRIEK